MSVAECALDSGVDLSVLLRGPPRLTCRLGLDYYAPITKMGGINRSWCPIVCLSHAPSSKRVRFRFMEVHLTSQCGHMFMINGQNVPGAEKPAS